MHITGFTTEPLNTVLDHRAKGVMADAGIKAESIDRVHAGVKAEAVMFDLADTYGRSYGAVNKIVHAQR